jgi:hypothetical protein
MQIGGADDAVVSHVPAAHMLQFGSKIEPSAKISPLMQFELLVEVDLLGDLSRKLLRRCSWF